MAKVGSNILTRGLTGMLGDQLVFRNLYGETIVSTKPVRTVAPSAAQIANQQMFSSRQIWARANKTNPVYVAASSANKARFPGGFHAAMHDAAVPPEIESGRHFKDGALVFGAGQEYKSDDSEPYVMELYAKGITVASIVAEIGTVTEQPSAQAAGHSFTFDNAFAAMNSANIVQDASPDGSGNETWQIDVNAELAARGWTLVDGNYIAIKVTLTDNYGNVFSIDPTDLTAEEKTTFGEALQYLDAKIAS